jgi:hypothetical protein
VSQEPQATMLVDKNGGNDTLCAAENCTTREPIECQMVPYMAIWHYKMNCALEILMEKCYKIPRRKISYLAMSSVDKQKPCPYSYFLLILLAKKKKLPQDG